MAAFQASAISVGTSPVSLVSGLEGRYQIIVELALGDDVWLGDASVGVNAGFHLYQANGGTGSTPDVLLLRVTMDVLLDSTDALYAVSGTAGQTVYLMVNPR